MEESRLHGNCGCVVEPYDPSGRIDGVVVIAQGEYGTARFFFCGKDERCAGCEASSLLTDGQVVDGVFY